LNHLHIKKTQKAGGAGDGYLAEKLDEELKKDRNRKSQKVLMFRAQLLIEIEINSKHGEWVR